MPPDLERFGRRDAGIDQGWRLTIAVLNRPHEAHVAETVTRGLGQDGLCLRETAYVGNDRLERL